MDCCPIDTTRADNILVYRAKGFEEANTFRKLLQTYSQNKKLKASGTRLEPLQANVNITDFFKFYRHNLQQDDGPDFPKAQPTPQDIFQLFAN